VIGGDGSANAQRAVDFVSRLPTPRGGHVTVFTAVDHMHVPAHALTPRGVGATVTAEVKRINAERTAQAEKGLANAEATLTRAGWQVRTRVAIGAPLRELLATVDSADAELLVVGGADKHCLVEIRLTSPRRVIVIQDSDVEAEVAIGRVAERAARAVHTLTDWQPSNGRA
jgi:nucleotide-binding universal stress UspA family protein